MKKRPWGLAGVTAALLLTSAAPVWAELPASGISAGSSASGSVSTGGASGSGPAVALPGGPAAGSAGLKMDGGGNSTAPVDTKISREKAIELVQSALAIPSAFKLQNVNYQSSLNSSGTLRGSWSLNFVKMTGQRFSGSINVTVDADSGQLLSFYRDMNQADSPPQFPPKVSFADARKIATDYVAKMNPGTLEQLKYAEEDEKNIRKPLTGSVQYPFRWVRTVNGVPFPQNTVSLTVNGEGEIVNYNEQWDPELTFAAPDGVLAAEKAASVYQEQADLRLRYVIPYGDNGNAKVEPYVSYEMQPFQLDAKTGDALLPSGGKRPAPARPAPVSDHPLAEVPAAPLKLTKEQAVSRVNSVLPVPKDAKLEDASYRENTDPRTGVTQTVWDLRWSLSGDEQKNSSLSAAVDSTTGTILRYSKYSFRPADASGAGDKAADLPAGQLQSKAAEYVRALAPAYAHELYPEPREDLPEAKLGILPNYPFNYHRTVGGIITDDSVNVSLDRKTGELQEYYSNISTFSYPAEPPKVIAEGDAKKAHFALYNVELQYVIDWKGQPGSQYYGTSLPMEKYNLLVASGEIKPESGGKPQTRLVYNITPKYTSREELFLDAVTGEWRSRENGTVVKPMTAPPTDIQGHWAEEALNLMLDYQALDVVDGQVKPDGLITRGEMVKMLLAAVNGGYRPLAAAAYAAREASFSDVAKDSKYFAYVENAIDRNLIDRGTGTFQPDAPLSRSELADLIVRALGYRKLAQLDGLFVPAATDLAGVSSPGAIALVDRFGIMTTEGGKFSPQVQMTRAQAATAFYKYLQARAQLQDTPVQANPVW